jgi:AcrR family transcriptional regulator
MGKANSTGARERILDAAEIVVIEQGVTGMTLEAVAARAKVSKGGLLYHFPSKEDVVRGLVTRVAAIVEPRFNAELAKEPAGHGRHARTMLRLMTDPHDSLFPRLQRLAAPLLMAMAGNQNMLNPMRRFFQRVHQGMLDDGLSPDRAWLVLAALDGLKFWRIFGVLQPKEGDVAGLRNLLTQIINNK